MPKIRATDFNIQTGNVSSVTVVVPPHVTGDLLFVVAGKDDATGNDPATATSGWARGGDGVSGGATTAAVRAAWFWKVAASSAEPDLVITSSDADSWSILAVSIAGAHGTPIDASSGNGNTDSTGAPFAVTGVTTNYANSLVLYACLSGGTGCPVPYPGLQLIGAVDSGNEGVALAYTIKQATGATGDKNFYTDAVNSNCIGFCVAIRDDGSSNLRAPYWKSDYAELVHPFRGSGTIITGDAWGTALTNYPTLGKDAVADVVQEDISGPTFTPYTTEANNATDADVLPFPATEATGDYIAFGYSKPFMSLVFDTAGCTQGVAGVVAWEYWDGSAWTALTSVTDGTTGFTAAVADGQVVRWAMPAKFNWTPITINGGASLFYVRARCTTVYTTNPTVSQVYVGGHAALYDAVGQAADAGVVQFENASTITAATSGVQTGGTYIDLGTTVTATGKIICGTFQFSLPRDYVDSARMKEGGGVHVMFADTSFNRRTWCIGSYRDEQTNDAQRNRFAIQWAQATDTSHSKSTTAPTVIADVFIGHLAPRGAGSVAFSHMIAVTPANAVVNGGTSANPISLAEFLALGDASPVQLFRDGVVMVPVTFGSNDVLHVALDDFTLQFPAVATPWSDIYNVLPRSQAHYDTDYLGFIIAAASGDTVKMTNGKITSKTRWRFEVTSGASASASYDFTNLLLQNALVTLRAVCTWASVTFQECVITQNSATISGCTFLNSYLTSNNPTNISDSTFISGGTGHAMELNSATPTSLNFTDLFFTGYGGTPGSNPTASSGSTNAAIYNNSGKTITITIIGGDTPAVRNGANSTTVIVLSPVTIAVNVKDILDSSNIVGARVLLTASDGYGPLAYQDSTTITRSGSTATATCTGHGLLTDGYAVIKGAEQQEYNGVFQITKLTDDVFSYTVSGTSPLPSGLTLHLDFTDVDNLTIVDTDRISQVDDLSGNSRHFVQTTSYQRPYSNVDGYLGQSALFDASNGLHLLSTGFTLDDFINAAAGTIVVRCVQHDIDTNTAGGEALFGPLYGATGIYARETSPSVFVVVGSNYAGFPNDEATASTSLGTIQTYVWRHTGGNVEIRVGNGTPATTASGDTASAELSTVAAVGNDGGAGNPNVSISHVLCWDRALTEGEISTVLAILGGVPIGTITTTGAPLYGTTDSSGNLSTSRSYGSDQPITGRVRRATTGTLYKTGIVSGTVDSVAGFTTNVQLIRDE